MGEKTDPRGLLADLIERRKAAADACMLLNVDEQIGALCAVLSGVLDTLAPQQGATEQAADQTGA